MQTTGHALYGLNTSSINPHMLFNHRSWFKGHTFGGLREGCLMWESNIRQLERQKDLQYHTLRPANTASFALL
eukprot:2076822-Heterocapsa_arctica.AAC.1